jgi:hypothetical protein
VKWKGKKGKKGHVKWSGKGRKGRWCNLK